MKILLVDDQLLFLESLKIVLENMTDDIEVVGLASDGKEAVEKTENLHPDVILMDVRMPGMDGVTATKLIKEKYPYIHLIMLTTFEDDEYVKEALKNGAEGYMLKNIPPEMLISSIRAVMTGAVLISPAIAGNLIDNIYDNTKTASKELKREIPEWYKELSSREKHLLKLVMEGKTNKEISSIVHISPQTVRNYISTLYSKLNVNNRSEAVRKAQQIESFFFN